MKYRPQVREDLPPVNVPSQETVYNVLSQKSDQIISGKVKPVKEKFIYKVEYIPGELQWKISVVSELPKTDELNFPNWYRNRHQVYVESTSVSLAVSKSEKMFSKIDTTNKYNYWMKCIVGDSYCSLYDAEWIMFDYNPTSKLDSPQKLGFNEVRYVKGSRFSNYCDADTVYPSYYITHVRGDSKSECEETAKKLIKLTCDNADECIPKAVRLKMGFKD